MQKFVKKLIIFLIPLFLVGLFIISILLISSELTSYDSLVKKQFNEDLLLGLAYSNPTLEIKFKNTKLKNPEIISLGTSRVMQFRDYFFLDPDKFYNAGGGIRRLKDFNSFIETIKLDDLKVMIIGLDQYFFNKNFDDLSQESYKYGNQFSYLNIINNQKVIRDIINGKINIFRVLEGKHLGLTALMYHEGFRKDGSYYYGRMINNFEEYYDKDFRGTFDRIKFGNRRFQYGDNVNPESLIELKFLLENCKKKNIYVIGILPPYANAVWKKMKSKGNNYQYIFNLFQELKPIFELYSFDLFDFSDIATLGSNDDETIGGFHGSEVAYLRMLIKMTEDNAIMKSYINLNDLKTLLDNVFNSREIKYEVF